MGFNLPNSPRSSSGNDHQATSRSVSVGTSMASEDVDAPRAPVQFPSRRQQRRNAMIPILAVEAMGSPRTPHVGMTTDHRMALLQFQEQLRMRGLMGDNHEPSAKGPHNASSNAGAGHVLQFPSRP